jgi:radical SAM superfamily enzyme YgiQ (UPF0313 family)
MRVLLINSNRKGDLLAAPPIGLCYVAEAAKDAGHEVKVLDLCFTGNDLRGILSHAVKSYVPKIIGISIRNIDNVNMLYPVFYFPEVVRLMNYIREVTTVPVVLGGSGASLMPAEVLRECHADYIVVSDGETSFCDLLRAIEKGEIPWNIPGVGMFLEGKFHLTKPRHSAFTSRPPALGEWIDVRPYRRVGGSYSIQSKRGCRQHCIYCTYNQLLEGNKMRLRQPSEVVDEIDEALHRYSQKSFEFVDSVFNDPFEHSVAILEEIIRRPWKAEFTAMGVSPRHLDHNYLDLMWKAGFRSIMITPESASEDMLASYGKGFCGEDVVKAAEALGKSSFAAWWFFLIGGPGETNETLQESLDFVQMHLVKRGRSVTNVANFFMGVRLYPGTALWDTAMEEGVISASVNPLQMLWYMSRKLDLDRAIRQMVGAASRCPEIYLGFHEWVLALSREAAIVFRFLRLPRPYWRHFPAINRLALNLSKLVNTNGTSDVAPRLRAALEKQQFADETINPRIR